MGTKPIGLRPVGKDEKDIIERAIWAEKNGYDRIWVSEGWRYDVFVTLTGIAYRTDSIELGTSIANVYSRSPAVLSMASSSLSKLSGDRFSIGLGTSHPELISGLHGIPYDRPIRRTFETIELIKAYTGSETVDYEGEVFEVYGFAGLDANIPIFNAAMGPKNLELTGKLCDGWIPYNIPFSDLDAAFEIIADGAREVNRDPANITVTPWVPAAVSEDVKEARNAIRRNIAWYTGNFKAYRRAIEQTFPIVDEIVTHWQAENEDEAIELVTDGMVDSLGVSGRPDEVREQFREVSAKPIVDSPIVVTPRDADPSLVDRTFSELSPMKLYN